MLGSNSNLDLLIHCHVVPAPHPRKDAPTIVKGLKQLVQDGLIYETEEAGRYSTTPRGGAHLKQLCNLPLPSVCFVDYKGEKICNT